MRSGKGAGNKNNAGASPNLPIFRNLVQKISNPLAFKLHKHIPRIKLKQSATLSDYKLNFRPELQGLRAIAILLVIFAHAELGLVEGGFIGVDVFFVLSGFLITGLLVREHQQNGRLNFYRFYTNRLKRLLPALAFMVSISILLAVWFLSDLGIQKQLSSAPYALTWTSNLYFNFKNQDYFDDLSNHDLFLHTWSLSVEEQYYLIWPLIILLLYRISKPNIKNNSIILIGLGIITISSFALSLYWTKTSPQAAFYQMPSRIWQLSLGALVYVTLQQPAIIQRKFLASFVWLVSGLGLIIGSALGLHPNMTYPGYWALLPATGAALLIFAAYCIPAEKVNPLRHPALVWLGDRSYSLYLWHWPIFMLGFSLGYQGRIIPTLGLILGSLLVSMFSYRYIELPFWKGKLSKSTPPRILLFGSMAIMIVATVHYFGVQKLPDPLLISQKWRTDSPIIYQLPCDSWYSSAKVQPCRFGGKDAEKNTVLLGDSIGAQWFSLVPEIFRAPLWHTTVFTKSSCPIIDEDFFYKRIGRIFQVCTDWRTEALNVIDKIKPDIVFIGSSATYGFTESQTIEGSARILDRLSKAANTVIIIAGTPSLGFDGPGCVARNIKKQTEVIHNTCSAKAQGKRVETNTRLLIQVAKSYRNVYLLNLNDLVCPDSNCSALSKDGVVVYRDSFHLTNSFVLSMIPQARQRLKQLIGVSPAQM